ncbi:hypothetical protein RclHR1_01680010 [Rhizophagus clarus]|uniref:Uncharacterized protein n=1 Tax=Rhizophagus clarus TaxID=94130 RepID=A0A2Z6QVR0_9GLOM|nr:hypothetical protein RclHR1_01680010 [Rhizophagus clarus]
MLHSRCLVLCGGYICSIYSIYSICMYVCMYVYNSEGGKGCKFRNMYQVNRVELKILFYTRNWDETF